MSDHERWPADEILDLTEVFTSSAIDWSLRGHAFRAQRFACRDVHVRMKASFMLTK